MHHLAPRPLTVRVAIAALALALVAGVGLAAQVAAAPGQDCDPIYGCEPTTTAPQGVVSECRTETAAAEPGTRVDVTITNVPNQRRAGGRCSSGLPPLRTASASSATT